jgi:hypothetical protein
VNGLSADPRYSPGDSILAVYPMPRSQPIRLGSELRFRPVARQPTRGEVLVDLDPGSNLMPIVRTVLDGLGYRVTEIRR